MLDVDAFEAAAFVEGADGGGAYAEEEGCLAGGVVFASVFAGGGAFGARVLHFDVPVFHFYVLGALVAAFLPAGAAGLVGRAVGEHEDVVVADPELGAGDAGVLL